MRTHKTLYLTGFLILALMVSSCASSRKSRKSPKRYNRERCDCSRFSEMVSNNKVTTVDWFACNGGQKLTQ
jgi:hypothetical protein